MLVLVSRSLSSSKYIFWTSCLFMLLCGQPEDESTHCFSSLYALEFDLAVPPEVLKKSSGVVHKPVSASDPNRVNQMPLLMIKPHNRASS